MVEFVVRAPGLHPWDHVYLAGDAECVGRWRADGVRLDWRDGAFGTHLDLPDGADLRYLFTRGQWRNVEHDDAGGERHARHLRVRHGQRVEVTVAGWGRNAIVYHADFTSQFLPHPHTLTVYLPPEYDLDTYRRYPVFYLHDGQNLFDAHTSFAGVAWRCDEAAEQLARRCDMQPVILVGVSNTPDRLREYGPTPDAADDLAHAYGRFLVEEVKPFIDDEYRTRTDPAETGVGGSSMGGLISLHLTRTYPQVFGRCAALSPSLWWDGERLLTAVGDDPRSLAHARVWLDVGLREGHSEASMAANARRAARLAFHLRASPSGVKYEEDPHGLHNEEAWGRRFPDVLKYLFPSA